MYLTVLMPFDSLRLLQLFGRRPIPLWPTLSILFFFFRRLFFLFIRQTNLITYVMCKLNYCWLKLFFQQKKKTKNSQRLTNFFVHFFTIIQKRIISIDILIIRIICIFSFLLLYFYSFDLK